GNRCERGESAQTECADVNPCCGGELEILCQPSGKFDTTRRVGLVGEAAGIAHFVESFFIESRCSKLRLFPITGSDVRPSHAQFVSASVPYGNHLQFTARS